MQRQNFTKSRSFLLPLCKVISVDSQAIEMPLCDHVREVIRLRVRLDLRIVDVDLQVRGQ